MSNQKKILIVEDESFLRELYVKLVTKEGYLVDTAEDGAVALQKIKEEKYDLISLDIMLPKMDGLAVLENLTEDERKNSKIVVLSMLDQDEVIKKVLELGVVRYLVKGSCTPNQVLAEWRYYLSEITEKELSEIVKKEDENIRTLQKNESEKSKSLNDYNWENEFDTEPNDYSTSDGIEEKLDRVEDIVGDIKRDNGRFKIFIIIIVIWILWPLLWRIFR